MYRRIIYIYVINSVMYVLAQYSIAQQKSEATTLQLVLYCPDLFSALVSLQYDKW